MKPLTLFTFVALLLSCFGCSGSFAIRNTDTYRKDTRTLLATKDDEIKACYDAVLAEKNNQKGLKGKVTVKFTVAEDTGMITDARLDEAETNAPKHLCDCVLKAIEGLALDPPDQYPGIATFTWKFKMEKEK